MSQPAPPQGCKASAVSTVAMQGLICGGIFEAVSSCTEKNGLKSRICCNVNFGTTNFRLQRIFLGVLAFRYNESYLYSATLHEAQTSGQSE
jgi:hypothetical protein